MKKGYVLIVALFLLFTIELVAQTTVYNFEFDIISNYPGQLTVEWNTVNNQGDWQSMLDLSFQGTTTINHQIVRSYLEPAIYQVKVYAVNSVWSPYNETRRVYPGNNYFLIDLREPFQEPEPDPQ